MSVFDLKTGESAVITDIKLSGGALARLDALGIRRGSTVEALCFSLFKSSILLSCGSVRVGIRKSLAQKIEVRI